MTRRQKLGLNTAGMALALVGAGILVVFPTEHSALFWLALAANAGAFVFNATLFALNARR